jgi:hypothetical protein
MDEGADAGPLVLMGPDLQSSSAGESRSVQLTPDDQTGIGLWTEVFIKTIKTGNTWVRTPLLPPMFTEHPGPADSDIKAMYAYLQHPPIKSMGTACRSADVK